MYWRSCTESAARRTSSAHVGAPTYTSPMRVPAPDLSSLSRRLLIKILLQSVESTLPCLTPWRNLIGLTRSPCHFTWFVASWYMSYISRHSVGSTSTWNNLYKALGWRPAGVRHNSLGLGPTSVLKMYAISRRPSKCELSINSAWKCNEEGAIPKFWQRSHRSPHEFTDSSPDLSVFLVVTYSF